LGNKVIPDPKEILLWENKVHMHKVFEKLDISCPKSMIVEKENFNINRIEKNFKYPFLIKEPFSNHSKGIFHIKNRKNLINISNDSFKNVSAFIVQSLVNMTKDSRVVVVNNSINYSYWRSKKITSSFNTTSTSNGSALDFTPLSKKNQKIIIEYTKKLGVSIAAYDVTFENDNTKSKPIILEVSTSFLLNPIPTGKFLNQPYLKYKASPIKFGKDRSKMALDFKFNVLNKFINET
jgi:glutathione synthase/RimK-type ligase-like ATP-grasp enzyme